MHDEGKDRESLRRNQKHNGNVWINESTQNVHTHWYSHTEKNEWIIKKKTEWEKKKEREWKKTEKSFRYVAFTAVMLCAILHNQWKRLDITKIIANCKFTTHTHASNERQNETNKTASRHCYACL